MRSWQHRLQASRCEEEAWKLETPWLALRFLALEGQCLQDKVRVLDCYVGRHLRCGAQALGAGMGVACAQVAEQEVAIKETSPWRGYPSRGGSQCSVFISTTRRSGQLPLLLLPTSPPPPSLPPPPPSPSPYPLLLLPPPLTLLLLPPSDSVRWYVASTTSWFAARQRARSSRFAYSRSQASANTTPVQVKLKRSSEGLVARVQAAPKPCHRPSWAARANPGVGCPSRGRAWTSDGHGSSGAQSRKFLKVLAWSGAEALRYTGRSVPSPVGDQNGCAADKSQQTQASPGHDKVESSEQQIAGALVDGSLAHKEGTPAAGAGAHRAAPGAPLQNGIRSAGRRMEVRDLDNGCANPWRERAARPGDVHWKTLTVLDKWHRRDRKPAKKKEIAECAKEASKGAAAGCCTARFWRVFMSP